MPVQPGSVVEGVVTGITSFGAFIALPGGQTGLVHISEIADGYVRDVNDYLKPNDKVKVKVISVDPKGKIGLSIKRANPENNRSASASRAVRKKPQPSFEDKLTRFLKESEERQQVLKRNQETRRGGRGNGGK